MKKRPGKGNFPEPFRIPSIHNLENGKKITIRRRKGPFLMRDDPGLLGQCSAGGLERFWKKEVVMTLSI
jgi:hypothetical protein